MTTHSETNFDGQKAADPLDRAGAEVESQTREAVKQQREAAARQMPKPRADGSGLCVDDDCMEPVEPGRLALDLGLCLGCAEAREKARQRARRGF